MSIEQELQNTDFSRFSNVKDSLKQRLHDMRNQKRELSWDEPDDLAAAGGPNRPQPNEDPLKKLQP